MASIETWPTSLPQVPSEYSISAKVGATRFETEEGPPLSYARSTVFQRVVSVSFECSVSQINDFWDFYRNEMGNGALPFYWADPADTGIVCRWLIDGEPEAEWTGPTLWTLSLTLLQTRAE
jgi:hypothetical protein